MQSRSSDRGVHAPSRVSRRRWLAGLVGAAAGCVAPLEARPDGARRFPVRGAELIDLTHTLSPSSPYIPVKDATFPFRRAPIATIAERGVYANRWELTEHIGTHMDAPCHFDARARCVEAVPLAELVAAAIVIDISARAAHDADAELTLADLETWGRAHGPWPSPCAVLLRSGWSERWPSQQRFANPDATGTLHFPGFSRAALDWLANRPEVVGVGTDTLSIDPGRDMRYEGHRVLARANKWALECLAHLESLPPVGATLFVGALPVEAASGSPARVVAWLPDS